MLKEKIQSGARLPTYALGLVKLDFGKEFRF